MSHNSANREKSMTPAKVVIHPAHARGTVDMGWLRSAHSFSFGNWFNPNLMGFGDLRVINEDHIAAGAGFPTHPHRDMEILTYVISGAIAHRDSTGDEGVTLPGQIQRMTAGAGIRHSEMNPSESEPTHLLQIWLHPERKGLPPSYEQAVIPAAPNGLAVAASGHGDGAVHVHQDCRLLVANWAAGGQAALNLPDRQVWIQMIAGKLTVAGETLRPGDGMGISAPMLELRSSQSAHFLVFDLKRT